MGTTSTVRIPGGRAGIALASSLLAVGGCSVTVSPHAALRAPKHHVPTASTAASPSRAVPTRAAEKPILPRAQRGASAWRLSRPATGGQIQGFSDPSSVAPGGAIRFMVSTTARSFTAAAYRIGGYRGGDGRLAWESPSIPRTPQPAATLLPSTRTVVAHWAPSFTVRTGGWSPGFYLMKLSAASGYQAYVPFTVRSPTTRGRIVLVAPLIDWEAYNTWGGYDLYRAPPYQYRSWAVSFDRPNPAPGADQFLYNVLPTVVLAERLGLRLAYETDVDVAARPGLLDGATGLVTMGHDEYWTEQERRHVTAARNRGTNLAFLSSNTMYWRVRLHGSQRGPDRVVVAYKTEADTNDPLRLTQPGLVTGRWRDLPDADPENSLTGTLYECYPVDEPYRVAAPHWWGFAGTGVRRGTELPHLVGDEADRVYPIPSTPHPLQILSYLTYDCGGVLTSTESTYYTTRSGAGVIDLGTQRWTCALAPRCPGLPPQDDLFARQVTTNVLHAFAAGPAGVAHPARDNVGRFWLPAVNEVPTS